MISRIFNCFIKDIDNRSKFLLETIQHPLYNLNDLAEITARQCPLTSCIGFVDGTVRPMCRPSRFQEMVFNGHKRKHALKYQSIMLVNGMMILHGPFEGRRHDSFLMQESEIVGQLAQLPRRPDGSQYVIYGDPAYALQAQVVCPYPQHINYTPDKQLFNESMSTVRQSVEYGFGKTVQYFSFLDFAKGQKLLLSPIGRYYRVGVLLSNIHTCLYGSAVTSLLRSQPPHIREYLSLVRD